MKNHHLIACTCMLLLFNSCQKETVESNAFPANEASLTTAGAGPVKAPNIVWTSTTKTQFIANADGNGTAEFTLNFAAKKPDIKIQAFTFLAYETNENDALAIFVNNIPAFFSPTSFYGAAKAVTSINGTNIKLPDDGSAVPVTFTIRYNTPSAAGNVKSGDTVSVQLAALQYVNKTSPYILQQSIASPFSPQMMITGSRPQLGLNIYQPDMLHKGLTRILQLQYVSQGGSLGVNNLPLVINCFNALIRKDLIVKDENGQTVKTTTVRNGNNYTILFPSKYNLNVANSYTFNIYADVRYIFRKASIHTKLQPPGKFSWTDIAGGQTTPFVIENAAYYHNYPNEQVTVTHN